MTEIKNVPKTIEDELRINTERLNAVLSAIPDKMFIIDSNGVFVDFYAYNPEGLRINSDKIRGSTIFDLFEKSEAERHLSVHRECIKDRSLKVINYHISENDSVRSYEARVVPLENDKVVAIVRETTEQRKYESTLKENEKKFRDLAEMLPEVIFESDLKMNLTYANRRGHELFGYDEDVIGTMNCMSLVAPFDYERVKENTIKRIQGIKDTNTEYTGVKKDGTLFPMLLHSAVITRDGAPVGFRGVIVDLSAKKQSEEAVKRAEKLESIGLLAGGIAHDFNNLLGGLFGTIELANGELEKSNIEGAKDLLLKAVSVYSRARDLTLQLLTFSKGGVPSKKVADLGKTVTETVDFVLSGSSIKPVFKMEKDLWMSEIDTGQISQAIDNITINAIQSMPEGGLFEVSMKNIEVEEEGFLSLGKGCYVKISLKDQGAGIPEKFLKRIFDPFFTTKQSGSGLGLAISWSIVKKHGGTIDVESEQGEGSIFHIYIPAFIGEQNCFEKAEETTCGESLTGRILVMDDDFIIREVTGKILAEAGYEVVKVECGEKAVQEYLSHLEKGKPFDVVILDLTIPGGMGGKEAVCRLKDVDPDVCAVATSGYSEDPVMSNPGEFCFFDGIPKPYLKKSFLDVINRAVCHRRS